MQGYLPIIYDGIIVVIFISHIFKGKMRGFMRTMAELLSWIASLALGILGSTVIAPAVYETFIRGRIIEGLTSSISEFSSPQLAAEQILAGIEELPAFLRSAIEMGFGRPETQLAELSATIDVQGLIAFVADDLIAPVVIMMIQVICFFIIFAVSSFVLGILCRAFSLFNHIPLVGGLNSLLGALLGAGMAFILVSVITAVITPFVGIFFSGAQEYIQRSVIDSTVLLRYFVDNNFVLGAFALL